MIKQPKKEKIHLRVSGRALQKMRKRIMQEQPLCVMCDSLGIVTQGAELDHILPLYKGGDNNDSNLQMLCIECHKKKTAEDLGFRYKPEIGTDGWPTVEVGVGGPKTLA